ncbi:MAG: hypothetical protein K0U24_02220 [Gammaproteobacteria bacterium]|nr:hypothetical protein [Gammaproteobacteria bacterium]
MNFLRAYPAGSNLATRARWNKIQANQIQQKVSILDSDRIHTDIVRARESLLATSRIGYQPPGLRPGAAPFHLAPEARDAHNRDLSRYRIIHGPVTFYDEDFEPSAGKSTDLYVMSTNGINLMGTSPNDKANYVQHDGRLKQREFQAEYDQIADHIVHTAQQEGRSIVTAAFGSGIYLRELNREQKAIAQKIIFQSFAKASLKYQTKVYWDAYNAEGKRTYDELKQQDPTTNYSFMQVETGDMVQIAKDLQDQRGEQVALLNAGSDRTIGGKYVAEPGKIDPRTGQVKDLPVEEKLAQQSDLLFLQSATFNEGVISEQLDLTLATAMSNSATHQTGAAVQEVTLDRGDRDFLGSLLELFQEKGPDLPLERKQSLRGEFDGIKGLTLVGDSPNATIVCTDASVEAAWHAFFYPLTEEQAAFLLPTSTSVAAPTPQTGDANPVISFALRYPEVPVSLLAGFAVAATVSLTMGVVAAATVVGVGQAYKFRYGDTTAPDDNDSEHLKKP